MESVPSTTMRPSWIAVTSPLMLPAPPKPPSPNTSDAELSGARLGLQAAADIDAAVAATPTDGLCEEAHRALAGREDVRIHIDDVVVPSPPPPPNPPTPAVTLAIEDNAARDVDATITAAATE